MALFERGDKPRRLCRLEVEGTRLRTVHWFEGTDGNHEIASFDTAEAAEAACRAATTQLIRDGYRTAVEPAARLVTGAPLSDSPRFLFAKGRLFGWVEARGTSVIALQGRRDEEASLTPTIEACGSAAEAIARRDQLISLFVARGYELDAFGSTAEARRARDRKHALANVAALEQLVEDDPSEANWSVLEDKLLEEEDPRGQLLELVRTQRREHEDNLRAEFLPLLLGSRHATFARAISQPTWRGGYLVSCTLRPDPVHALDAFLATPAARLLVGLGLASGNLGSLRELGLRLARVRPRMLRELRFDTEVYIRHTTRVLFDVAQLVPLELHALGSSSVLFGLRNLAAMPSLRMLEANETSASDVAALLASPLPELHTLKLTMIDDEVYAPRAGLLGELREVFRPIAERTPKLERLLLRFRHRDTFDAVRDVVERSPLGGRVKLVELT